MAVGHRGHIVISDDSGKTWKQASVPVSNDLVAVSFPSARQGWAVGHGGVVLHSVDGGATWVKQMDGRRAAELAVNYYHAHVGAIANADRFMEREKALVAEGGIQPFMDVFFEDENNGYVIGTFNRIFRTEDGGKTWTPWMDRTENPSELHLYAIRGNSNGLYMTGEQGMVWRLNAESKRFVAIPTPYKGTLFGLLADRSNNLLVFGMRGTLFRTADKGKVWVKVAAGSASGIVGGAVLSDGSMLIANQVGELLRSKDQGKTFEPVTAQKPMAYFGVTSLSNMTVGLAGSEGVRLELIR